MGAPAHGKPGFRVLPFPPRIAAPVVEQFRGLASPNIADAMGRFGFMDSGIRSRSGFPLCGIAVTVNCLLGPQSHGSQSAPGCRAGRHCCCVHLWQYHECGVRRVDVPHCSGKKLGGIVVDGAIRDVDGITRLGFPAFSRTVCPGGCDKDGPGEINVPICCGGTVVAPGDIIVGDADGVVVVPRAHAEEIRLLVGELEAREKTRIGEIQRGVLFRAEIDESLRKKGVIE